MVGTATSTAGATKLSERLGDEGVGRELNLSEPDSITQFLDGLKEDKLVPETLVNNAAITRDDLILRMDNEKWDSVMQTNLTGTFLLTKGLLRGMLKLRRGRIVMLSSVVGSIGNAGQTNYAATKAGLFGFTKSLAREVASRSITANCIAPGFIDTDMTRELTEEQHDQLRSQIPLGRLGDATDVAAAVSFLCSEDAAYITGETIHVNGGMHMA